jgi:hypothetical protein
MGACPHNRGSASDGVCEICARAGEEARPGRPRPFAPLNRSHEAARLEPSLPPQPPGTRTGSRWRDPLASLFGPDPASARHAEREPADGGYTGTAQDGPAQVPAGPARPPRVPLDLSATSPDLFRNSPPTRPERALGSAPPPAPAAPPVSAPVPAPPAVAAAPSVPPEPPAPRPATAWSVLVACDRVYYMMRLADERFSPTLEFPADQPERRIPLVGDEMRIGRRSAGRQVDPEIDLAGPPADPGISRLHARLIRKPDGTWALVDTGSANGTLLNGQHVPAGEPVGLREGDRMHLGAWTVIVLLRR